MFDYLTGFLSENLVKLRSQTEATLRGCGRHPDDITKFWQRWIKHPDRNEWALVFKDEEEKSNLSIAEIAALLSEIDMNANGWFENIQMAAVKNETELSFMNKAKNKIIGWFK